MLSLLPVILPLFLTGGASAINFAQRNYDTISAIYNRTVYPINLDFIANGSASVPRGLFNENATGRISPLGNFSGFQDSTEYFFALAPIPQAPTYTAITKAQVVSFTSGCAEIAASVVYFTNSIVNPNSTNNGNFVTFLSQIAFWKFDTQGAVLQYDAWIPNLVGYQSTIAASIPPMPSSGSPSNSTAESSPATSAANTTSSLLSTAIQTLCGATQSLCTGNNTQYSSIQQCAATLSAKPFGSEDELWGDNVVCRQVHVLLARIRPEVHCPHVGPTGGGKCVNESYNDGYFLSDQALFGRVEGQNFVCPHQKG